MSPSFETRAFGALLRMTGVFAARSARGVFQTNEDAWARRFAPLPTLIYVQPAALAVTAAASSARPFGSAAMNQSAISLEVTNTVSLRAASRSKAFSR
jgi:hypothetical protein